MTDDAAGQTHDLGSFAQYAEVSEEWQAGYDAGRREVVAGVRAWCAINEIAEPPLDWEGLGEFLTRVIPPVVSDAE